MNTKLVLLLLVVVYITSCKEVIPKKDIPLDKRMYEFYSGKIESEFKKGAEYGTKVIVFDEYGIIEKVVTETKVDSVLVKAIGYPEQYIPQPSHYLQIKNDSVSFMIDLFLNKGYGKKNVGFISSEFNFEEMMQKFYIKDSLYDGRQCKYYEMSPRDRTFMWKGLRIKTEIETGQPNVEMYEKVISIDLDYKIKDDEFNVPENIEIE